MQRDEIGLPAGLAGRAAAARSWGGPASPADARTWGAPPPGAGARGGGGVGGVSRARAVRSRSSSPERRGGVPLRAFPAVDVVPERLADVAHLSATRAEVRRFGEVREHLGAGAADRLWRTRVGLTAGPLLRVPDGVRSDLVFLLHRSEEALVSRVARLAPIARALAIAPRADLCPFSGGAAHWPAWWAGGRWAGACRAERARRVTTGFLVPFAAVEFDDVPRARRAAHYPRVPGWWPEVPAGMPVLLPAILTYRASELVAPASRLAETLWAAALSDWVARIGATLAHCALRERRLWRLSDKLVRWIRAFLRAIFRDSVVRYRDVDDVLTAHEGLNWADVGRYRGEETATWVPYCPRLGVVDWGRCGRRPLARSSVIPWHIVEGAPGLDQGFWGGVRSAESVMTLDFLLRIGQGTHTEMRCKVGPVVDVVSSGEDEIVGKKAVMSLRRELEKSRVRREAASAKTQRISEHSSTKRGSGALSGDAQRAAKRHMGNAIQSGGGTEESIKSAVSVASSSSSDKVTPVHPGNSTATKAGELIEGKMAGSSMSRSSEVAELKRALSESRARVGTLTVMMTRQKAARDQDKLLHRQLRTQLDLALREQTKAEKSISSVRRAAHVEGAKRGEQARQLALQQLQQARKRSLAEADMLRKACSNLARSEGSSDAVEVIDIDGEGAEEDHSVIVKGGGGGGGGGAREVAEQQPKISEVSAPGSEQRGGGGRHGNAPGGGAPDVVAEVVTTSSKCED